MNKLLGYSNIDAFVVDINSNLVEIIYKGLHKNYLSYHFIKKVVQKVFSHLHKTFYTTENHSCKLYFAELFDVNGNLKNNIGEEILNKLLPTKL